MTSRERPQSFRLDDPDVAVAADAPPPGGELEAPDGAAEPAARAARPGRSRWGRLFWAASGTLLSLAVGLAVDGLVRELFARNDWLGWVGLAATALAALALAALAVREIVGLWRLGRIVDLREAAAGALARDDPRAARSVARDLVALYKTRPETARGRAATMGYTREIIDAGDLLALTERELMDGMDRAARRLVMESSRRVCLVTAISPRALVDMLFVLAESLRLVRRLALLYGGRPGALGLMRLSRQVVAHLAVTGGLAMSDGLAQQILGHGLAARLSARLGEGVVNGLLTARIGLAAIEVCRPLPFLKAPPVALKDVMSELARLDPAACAAAEADPRP